MPPSGQDVIGHRGPLLGAVRRRGRVRGRWSLSQAAGTATIIVPSAPRGPSQSRHGHADGRHVTPMAGCSGRPDRSTERGLGARRPARPAASAADRVRSRRRCGQGASRAGPARSPVGGVAAPGGGMSTSFQVRIGRPVVDDARSPATAGDSVDDGESSGRSVVVAAPAIVPGRPSLTASARWPRPSLRRIARNARRVRHPLRRLVRPVAVARIGGASSAGARTGSRPPDRAGAGRRSPGPRRLGCKGADVGGHRCRAPPPRPTVAPDSQLDVGAKLRFLEPRRPGARVSLGIMLKNCSDGPIRAVSVGIRADLFERHDIIGAIPPALDDREQEDDGFRYFDFPGIAPRADAELALHVVSIDGEASTPTVRLATGDGESLGELWPSRRAGPAGRARACAGPAAARDSHRRGRDGLGPAALRRGPDWRHCRPGRRQRRRGTPRRPGGRCLRAPGRRQARRRGGRGRARGGASQRCERDPHPARQRQHTDRGDRDATTDAHDLHRRLESTHRRLLSPTVGDRRAARACPCDAGSHDRAGEPRGGDIRVTL